MNLVSSSTPGPYSWLDGAWNTLSGAWDKWLDQERWETERRLSFAEQQAQVDYARATAPQASAASPLSTTTVVVIAGVALAAGYLVLRK